MAAHSCLAQDMQAFPTQAPLRVTALLAGIRQLPQAVVRREGGHCSATAAAQVCSPYRGPPSKL